MGGNGDSINVDSRRIGGNGEQGNGNRGKLVPTNDTIIH